MNVGVVVFPGSNCDRDVAYVTRDLLQQPTRLIWHQETDIAEMDVIILPGGFSYGDYLRCGAIAQFSPIMKAIKEHAAKGKLILGICNGFQVLTEVGLLDGALIRNRDLHFICDRVFLRVENSRSHWTNNYQEKSVITLPIAHGEGRYFAEADTLNALEKNGQILFRYCNAQGETTEETNPNGSLNNIAGITNRQGNVLGMMPHPERASDEILGASEGLKLFQGLLKAKMIA